MTLSLTLAAPVLKDATQGDGPREYALYGLRVRSEVPLPAPVCQRSVPPDGYDVEVRWGERKPIPDRPATGNLLAEFAFGDGRGYTLTDTGAGYTLRFHQTCEFGIAHDLRTVCVHLPPGVGHEMAALLFVGNVLACVLTMAGEYILHASAVEVGNGALAFVGGSGMGKSTLAALLCAGGARFIADDLLRLRPQGRRFLCLPGTGEIRLRRGAASVAESFPALVRGTTADERIVLRLDHPCSRPPLEAVVIPHPSRRSHAIRLQRLPCSRALLVLMPYPRIEGLQQKEHLQLQFQRFARIAASVPVFVAEIPWGPPFSTAMAEPLLRSVGLGRTAEVAS